MSDKLEDTLAARPSQVGGRLRQEPAPQARGWAMAGGTAANASLALGSSAQSASETAATNADNCAYFCMQYARPG